MCIRDSQKATRRTVGQAPAHPGRGFGARATGPARTTGGQTGQKQIPAVEPTAAPLQGPAQALGAAHHGAAAEGRAYVSAIRPFGARLGLRFCVCLKKLAGFSGALSSGQRYANFMLKKNMAA